MYIPFNVLKQCFAHSRCLINTGGVSKSWGGGRPDDWWVSLPVLVRAAVQWVETLWFCFLRVRHLFFSAMEERQSL